MLAVSGLTVTRIRAASGGHTQLTLRRDVDVLDGIAFGRDDLVGRIGEGDRVDVVARPAVRTFGGFESIQLEIRDIARTGSVTEIARPPDVDPFEIAGGAARAIAVGPSRSPA